MEKIPKKFLAIHKNFSEKLIFFPAENLNSFSFIHPKLCVQFHMGIQKNRKSTFSLYPYFRDFLPLHASNLACVRLRDVNEDRRQQFQATQLKPQPEDSSHGPLHGTIH